MTTATKKAPEMCCNCDEKPAVLRVTVSREVDGEELDTVLVCADCFPGISDILTVPLSVLTGNANPAE